MDQNLLKHPHSNILSYTLSAHHKCEDAELRFQKSRVITSYFVKSTFKEIRETVGPVLSSLEKLFFPSYHLLAERKLLDFFLTKTRKKTKSKKKTNSFLKKKKKEKETTNSGLTKTTRHQVIVYYSIKKTTEWYSTLQS